MEELAINKEEELFDLETLITEGVDTRVPITIEFPDGKKAAALIRPISTSEFQTIYNGNITSILVNILEVALMNKNEEPLPRSLIEAMPIGLPVKIIKQIFEISGIEIKNKTGEVTTQDLKDSLELFP
jgi:hypothetical protein